MAQAAKSACKSTTCAACDFRYASRTTCIEVCSICFINYYSNEEVLFRSGSASESDASSSEDGDLSNQDQEGPQAEGVVSDELDETETEDIIDAGVEGDDGDKHDGMQ